jgi:uncharacterized coiled-coil DUF342 family protein
LNLVVYILFSILHKIKIINEWFYIITELEAKLNNSVDDRQNLFERLVTAESQAESLKAERDELSRKTDDLRTGLHELGREHQTLQVILLND